MSQLRPRTVFRDDFRSDPRFWAHVYWACLETRVGDAFEDGPAHFLGVNSGEATAWLAELERLPVGDGCYPQFAVTAPVKKGWSAGVVLSLAPGDSSVQQVLISPHGMQTTLAVNAGAIPGSALTWDEVWQIASSAPEEVGASLVLLLSPAAAIHGADFGKRVRSLLRGCWQRLGHASGHLEEFLNRLAKRHSAETPRAHLDSPARNVVDQLLWDLGGWRPRPPLMPPGI